MQGNSLLKGIILKALGEEELTPEETSILDVWLTDEDNRRDYDNWKDKDRLREMILQYDDYDIMEGKEITQRKLQNRAKVIQLRNWYRYGAAAVVLLLAGAVWIFTHNAKTNKSTAGNNSTIAIQKDIAPGTTKAVLTLADGRKINLDSAGDAKLAEQAGITISKENGQLVYKQNGSATNATEYNTLATAKGETFVAQLADGTLAWLNAGSSIRYPVSFSGSERVVDISGEVYFEVRHDASKPFHVRVLRQNDTPLDIQVLGTHFNVNDYADEEMIKTTLVEGSVKISARDKIKILKPRQQAQVSNGTNEKDIRVISDVNTDEVIAWKNGLFNFNGADIPTAMRQLARWYNIDVVYEGEIPRDKFRGKVQRKFNLSQSLEILERAGLKFKVEGRKLIVKQ